MNESLYIVMGIIVVFLLIVLVITYITHVNKRKNSIEEINAFVRKNEYRVSKSMEFFNGNCGYVACFDDENERFFIQNLMYKDHFDFIYDEIDDVDIIQNGRSYNGPEDKIFQLEVVIKTTRDKDSDIHIILNEMKIKSSSSDYKKKIAFAKKLTSTVRRIYTPEIKNI